MTLAIITALAVGSSTILGAIIGSFLKKLSHKQNDRMLGFAAGIMLAAAILGLIIPSIESGGRNGIWITVAGILLGALFVNLADKFTPHLHNLVGIDIEEHSGNKESINRVLLFIMAIAIHNLPEGIAAGVGFGSDNISSAITVAIGISLQNIPEGMIVIHPLMQFGVSKKKALLVAGSTGIIEIIGTMIGYFAVSLATAILPFALAFAGGTMLYVISDEMIPETHSHGHEREATYSLLVGFIFMLVVDFYI